MSSGSISRRRRKLAARTPKRPGCCGNGRRCLNDLERDVALTRDRVDWVAKKFLLTAFREEEKLSWTDPWLQAIDLEYHNIFRTRACSMS